MSAKFTRFHFLLLSSCVLLGCGGGGSDPAPTTDTQSESTAETPAAPSAGGGTSTATASHGTRIDSSTPDGTVKEAMAAVQANEFERVWDLLPKNYQTDVNGLFKEFGNQVDPEMWDKSFNLLNRYVSVMVAKEDMVYQTPEAQAVLAQMKTQASANGGLDPVSFTPEKVKAFSSPLLKVLNTLLNSELSSTKKLKSFDGRVFCANTLDPVVKQFHELSKQLLEQTEILTAF